MRLERDPSGLYFKLLNPEIKNDRTRVKYLFVTLGRARYALARLVICVSDNIKINSLMNINAILNQKS